MAERRMINIAFYESDDFVFLEASQKSLYLQLMIHADDDGFVRGARGIVRLDGDSETDLDTLVSAGFILKFPSGVVLIRHWKWHNQVRKDLYKPTVCVDESALVTVDDNDVYCLIPPGTDSKKRTEQRLRSAKSVNSSFETDEFFAAALKRSQETHEDTTRRNTG